MPDSVFKFDAGIPYYDQCLFSFNYCSPEK